VTRLAICRSDGQRAVGGGTEGTYQEYFISSATPKGTCNAPKAPVDTDKDGVVDESDKCASTPTGTDVDATGCPVEVGDDEDTPVVLDADKDGVPDATDRCANTPAGTEVDATGCAVVTGDEDSGDTTTPVVPRNNATR